MKTVEQQFRRFMLLLAAMMFVGTVAELLLTEHMKSFVQWIPYILCGLGLGVVAGVLLRARRMPLLMLRWVMALVMAGSLFGIYQHLEHNYEFESEIHPRAAVSDRFINALSGGNPLLAPGILAVGAILAAVATYRHPELSRNGQRDGADGR